MCLTITYTCPSCRYPCGQATTHPCDRQPCVGAVNRLHPMKPKHFVNWTCEYEECVYSMTNRRLARFEVFAIREAQAKGMMLPDAGDSSSGEDNNNNNMDVDPPASVYPPVPDERYAPIDPAFTQWGFEATPAQQQQHEYHGQAQDDDASADDAESDADSAEGRVKKPVDPQAAQKAWDWYRGQLLLPRNQRSIPEFRQFGDNVEARIGFLLEKITLLPGPKSAKSSCQWGVPEDELLKILQGYNMSFGRISKLFLPRHPKYGCESRHSNLTGKKAEGKSKGKATQQPGPSNANHEE